MIGFVKDVEPLLERGQRDKIRVDERESLTRLCCYSCTIGGGVSCSSVPPCHLLVGRIQQLVRGFGAEWKRSIEVLNQEVMQSFTNFKNGTAILQVRESGDPLTFM